MAYRHNDALYKHKVRAHRLRKAAIVVTSITLVFALVVFVDWFLNQVDNSNTVISQASTTTVRSVNVSVYRTEYFQFQAPDDWIAVASESNEKKFVYVKSNNELITQKITIYVDRPIQDREADFKVTHVLPVETSPLGNFINLGEVSEHCKESWQTVSRDPARITHANVSFVCNPDSGQFNILVGINGGNERAVFDGFSSELHAYTIVYSDLTAYPGPGDLYNIVSSFNAL